MDAAQQSILVVDDTPENIDILHNLLIDSYKIKVAISGEKALKLIENSDLPDIILLDVMMPGMDGYALCRLLKADKRYKSIPIIFITSQTDSKDEKEGLELGACDYITKPFNPDIVKSRIKKQLTIEAEKKQLQEQLHSLKKQGNYWQKEFTNASLNQLVSGGENDALEFKSTLRWNIHAKRNDVKIENQCLKTVAAFLNSNGGVLLVGVDDDGNARGLDDDQFKNEDRLLLHWHNLLREYLGADMADIVHTATLEFQGKCILAVQCGESTRPVFMRRDNEEFFYVRMGNTSQALKPSEMLAYVDRRYGEAR